jgi:hypothetical protein
VSTDEAFLHAQGGTKLNSLNNILNPDNTVNDENDQINIIKHSHYYDNNNFNLILNSKHNCFSILSTNIQSLNAKMDELTIFINDLKTQNFEFSAICLQESWLSDNDPINHLSLDNYVLINQGKSCSSKGGVAIYLHNKFTYDTKMTLNSSTVWEGQVIQVSKGGLKLPIIIANIYRPPKNLNDNYKQFINEFTPTLNALEKINSDVIITGDFNIDLLKINDREVFSDFFDMLTVNSFYPKITLPTRFSNKHGTLIDNIFCKLSHNTLNTTSGILTKRFSDHQPYFTFLNDIFHNDTPPKFIKTNTYSLESIQKFQNDLKSANILNKIDSTHTADPNSNYNILHDTIEVAKNKYLFSKKTKFNKHKHKKTKWITKGLIKSIHYRDNLYKTLKCKDTDSPEYAALNTYFKDYNRSIKKCIRFLKQDYYKACFHKFKDDIRNTWKTINDILHKTKKQKLFPDIFDDSKDKITDKLEIANKFNRFFTSVGSSLANEIKYSGNKCYKDFLNKKYTNKFKFKKIDKEYLTNLINEMTPKTSCGCDGISMKLLKSIQYILIEPLLVIINQTLNTGIFPDKLKIAKVNPIYKKDDNTKFTNYRPISLLPAISKIFEKVIYNQLYAFFQNESLFYSSQYGFRKKHSTELAALEIVDRLITKMDKQETPLNIYLDLSKAFDTIDHKILKNKLEYYGIEGISLNLFSSYLNNRKQYVEFENTDSQVLDITTGVPQGSILGPLLFIIYINDMANVSDIFHSVIYADDTTLTSVLSSFETNKTAETNINNELAKISTWLKVNKLSLNIKKTKYMIFHTTQKQITQLSLKIDGTDINRVKEFNFLGLIINENLNWKTHSEKVSNSISKTIGILNRLKHFLPLNIKTTLYNSLILSHINYCLLVWGYDHTRMKKLQKRAIRTLTVSKYNAHTEPLFKSLNLLKIEDMLKIQQLKFYFKYSHNQLPMYFSRRDNENSQQKEETFVLNLNSSIHNYNTRIKHNLHIPNINHSYAQKCLRYKIVNTINNTPLLILNKIHTHSLHGFTNYAKNVLIQNYTETCYIQNCYICHRNTPI